MQIAWKTRIFLICMFSLNGISRYVEIKMDPQNYMRHLKKYFDDLLR